MSNDSGQKLAGKVAVVTGGLAGESERRSPGGRGSRRCERGDHLHQRRGRRRLGREGIEGRRRCGGRDSGVDATDAAAVKAAVEKTVATFGHLDILVNNAGTAIPKPFEEATLEELDLVIDLNIRGVMIATQAARKQHQERRSHHLPIGSCLGERNLTPGLAAYAATKAAVKMFTQGLAREVGGRGITVNNIQPGPIDTDLNPAAGDWATPQIANTALKRYGHVNDIAALVAFVAGPEASYITGASLTVDGGTNA